MNRLIYMLWKLLHVGSRTNRRDAFRVTRIEAKWDEQSRSISLRAKFSVVRDILHTPLQDSAFDSVNFD